MYDGAGDPVTPNRSLKWAWRVSALIFLIAGFMGYRSEIGFFGALIMARLYEE